MARPACGDANPEAMLRGSEGALMPTVGSAVQLTSGAAGAG